MTPSPLCFGFGTVFSGLGDGDTVGDLLGALLRDMGRSCGSSFALFRCGGVAWR